MGAYAVSRVLAQMVYGVTATDTVTFASVSVVLLLVVVLAAALAARRATSVDPMIALRGD